MVWQPEIDELERRKQLAYLLGGEERVQRHRDNGKLTVRERIDALVDSGTFRERGALAGKTTYDEDDPDRIVAFQPSNYVMGIAKIDGRRVVVGGDDFTVRGGAQDGAVGQKSYHAERMAWQLKLPIVRLVDGTGGGGSVKTIEDIGRTYIPGAGDKWLVMVRMLSEVPVVAAAMGSVAGIGAARVAASHFSIILKETGQLFTAGPPVVERGLGVKISKEDLGGANIHARKSGVCDNEAIDEEDAFRQIRAFLSYMPRNAWEIPARIESDDSPDRRDEELLSVIPRDKRYPYDARKLISCVVDRDSFFEIGRYYGGAMITGLARLNGYAVGLLAGDPMQVGGSLDGPASDKMTKFIDLCDSFNLPIVNLFDQPGFMIGVHAEETATIKRGARAIAAVEQSVVPWAAVIVRRAFGVAGGAQTPGWPWQYRVAWPSGEWGSLPIAGGVMAAYRREIEAADDPEAYTRDLEERLGRLGSPFRTAEAFGIEDIIDPRDTRPLLCEWVEMAYDVLPTIVGPKSRGMRP